MNDFTSFIIIALIFISIGFILGVLVSSLRGEKDDTGGGESPTSSQMDIMTPAPSEPKQRPSINIVDSLARAIRPDVSGLQPGPQSIVAQIDEVLQEELVNTSLEKRAVRLLESPGEGMVVMVGLDKYDGVDAVPDAEIRGIIRAAAAKWEKRLEEG